MDRWTESRQIVCLYKPSLRGKKITALLFPEAHMPWRMAGRMQNLNAAVSYINHIIVLQHLCWCTLKELIVIYIITFRAGHSGQRPYSLICSIVRGNSPLSQLKFIFMSIKFRKVFVTANMIPVNVSGYSNQSARQSD